MTNVGRTDYNVVGKTLVKMEREYDARVQKRNDIRYIRNLDSFPENTSRKQNNRKIHPEASIPTQNKVLEASGCVI